MIITCFVRAFFHLSLDVYIYALVSRFVSMYIYMCVNIELCIRISGQQRITHCTLSINFALHTSDRTKNFKLDLNQQDIRISSTG